MKNKTDLAGWQVGQLNHRQLTLRLAVAVVPILPAESGSPDYLLHGFSVGSGDCHLD